MFPLQIITTSNMSLQVCSCCGWSKVTTYHGLRTHQGKMGCTPRGVKVEESHQQYSSGSLGFTNYDNYEHFDLDVNTSFKTSRFSHKKPEYTTSQTRCANQRAETNILEKV